MATNTAAVPGYTPSSLERGVALLCAVGMFGLIGFLVVKGQDIPSTMIQPFKMMLALAIAIMGASLPGFLGVGVNKAGVSIRAGGALALFVLTYLVSPHMIGGSPPDSQQIASLKTEISQVRTRVMSTELSEETRQAVQKDLAPLEGKLSQLEENNRKIEAARAKGEAAIVAALQKQQIALDKSVREALLAMQKKIPQAKSNKAPPPPPGTTGDNKPIKAAALGAPRAESTVKGSFVDNFDTDSLGNSWKVINPGSDELYVESGFLTMESTKPLWLEDGKFENLVMLNQNLPKGDWRVSLGLKFPVQTCEEYFFAGVYSDSGTFLVGGLRAETKEESSGSYYHKYHCSLFSQAIKFQKGKRTVAKDKIFGNYVERPKDAQDRLIPVNGVNQRVAENSPIELYLTKQASKLQLEFKSLANPELDRKSDKLIFRKNGRLVLGFSQIDRQLEPDEEFTAKGVSLVEVDWVKVESLQ